MFKKVRKLVAILIAILVVVTNINFLFPATMTKAAGSNDFSSYVIGNSFTDDMRTVYEPLASARTASREGTYTPGRHVQYSTALTYIYDHPDAANSASPSAWDTALHQERWDVVTLQPYPGGAHGDTSTLASDTASINGMISAARENPANAGARFFVYQAWPAKSANYDAAYLAYTGNTPNQPSVLTRDYFTCLAASVAQTNPDVGLIPVGEVLYAINQKIKAGQVPGIDSIDDLYRDNYHLNSIGRNVAGDTAYAVIQKNELSKGA